MPLNLMPHACPCMRAWACEVVGSRIRMGGSGRSLGLTSAGLCQYDGGCMPWLERRMPCAA